MWFGILLVAAGLCGAAFASQAWILILCQGVLYALGGSKPSPRVSVRYFEMLSPLLTVCLYCPVTAYMCV